MRTIISKMTILMVLLMSVAFVGCSDDDEGSEPTRKSKETFEVNGVKFNMIKVVGGTFQMGSFENQSNGSNTTIIPGHKVTLSDYYIGETEVIQELWQAVMGNNPSRFTGSGKLPVEVVRWTDCQEFITKLNELTGEAFRLPTEAEWEFAARGGTKTNGFIYSGSNFLDEVAWYEGNSYSRTHEVGTKPPNELGLYDMSGNVWEWVQDWIGPYSESDQINPTGPSSGYRRVIRGGSWMGRTSDCRVVNRVSEEPSASFPETGFRLAF